MQVKLSQIPFVRLLIPFALGILAEFYYPSHFLFFYLGILSLGLLFLWSWREKTKGASYPLRWVNGVLVGIFLLSSGYCVTLLRTSSESKIYFGNSKGNGKDSILVTIISIPQEKEKTYKAIGEIKGIIKNRVLVKSTGKALLYFHKDSISGQLNYGNSLLVYSQLQDIEPPSNPDEFDYKAYLQNQGINYECYVSTYNYSKLEIQGSNPLLQLASDSRKKLISLLHDKIGGNEADVASAILLGYRDDLSRPVIQSFIDSGVVHVICVAGLHVGIIFLILSSIVVFPEKFKYSKLVSVVLILLLLWLYTLFTGLSTPVLRATIMFSFLTIGRQFRKYTNTVNTLAASAFLMLLFSPFSLGDVGFQLSYLSVLGIIIIYKPLLSIFNSNHWFLRKIWELICVSVSAQVAVFPLSLLYFHQFPNYFIITNLLVVPLLTIVICTGLFFFLTSWVPLVSTVAAWILQKSLLLINSIVLGASHLPFSVSKGISISIMETLLLFLFIVLVITYFSLRKKSLLISALSVLAIFFTLRTGEKIIHGHQQILAVYNIPGKPAIVFISGNQCLMPFNKVDSNDIAMHIQYNWWKLGVNKSNSLSRDTTAILLSGRLFLQGPFAQFNNNRIAIINQNMDVTAASTKLNLHCIIVSKGYDLDMLNLKNAFNFDTIIFDSSIPNYKLKKWEAECKELNLHYYSVKTQGAYIENC